MLDSKFMKKRSAFVKNSFQKLLLFLISISFFSLKQRTFLSEKAFFVFYFSYFLF